MKKKVSIKMDEKSVFFSGKFASQYMIIPGYGKIMIWCVISNLPLNLRIRRVELYF